MPPRFGGPGARGTQSGQVAQQMATHGRTSPGGPPGEIDVGQILVQVMVSLQQLVEGRPRLYLFQDGGPVPVPTATPTDVATEQIYRTYIEIQNPEASGGTTIHLAFGNPAGASSFAIPPGGTWYAEWPNIPTARVSIYHTKGSTILVPVIEF